VVPRILIKLRFFALAPIRADSTPGFQTFYMDYRILTAFAFGGPEKEFPIFRDLDQYNRTNASKLKALVELVKHLLIDDRIEVPEYKEDGSVFYPDPPPVAPGAVRPQKHKVVVHQEFVMMSIMVESVSFWLPVQKTRPTDSRHLNVVTHFTGFPRQRHRDCEVEWQPGL
jgi:hypothetical protein